MLISRACSFRPPKGATGPTSWGGFSPPDASCSRATVSTHDHRAIAQQAGSGTARCSSTSREARPAAAALQGRHRAGAPRRGRGPDADLPLVDAVARSAASTTTTRAIPAVARVHRARSSILARGADSPASSLDFLRDRASVEAARSRRSRRDADPLAVARTMFHFTTPRADRWDRRRSLPAAAEHELRVRARTTAARHQHGNGMTP